MKYALGNMLNGAGVRGLDTDAKAYIDAVVAAGATVTATQRNAINAFVKGGKTDGWWTSMRRIYLPIWGIAAPNSIDITSRISGTFLGTVTHSSGYIQGNGTSGYFNFNVTPSSLGIGPSSEMVGALCYTAGSLASRYISTQSGANALEISVISGGGGSSTVTHSAHVSVNTTTIPTGIVSVSRTSTTSFFAHQRRNNTTTTTFGSTTTASGGLTHNILGMARNNSGTVSQWSNAQFGAFFAGLGLSSSTLDSFTLNLETLWETCTGLTMP